MRVLFPFATAKPQDTRMEIMRLIQSSCIKMNAYVK